MADDKIENYGLKASFEFEVNRKSFASMDTVQSQLAGIEESVNDASSAVKGSSIGADIHKMASQISKQMRPIKAEFRALKAEMRNLEFGDLTDKKQFLESSRAVNHYIDSLKHLRSQVKGNTAEEREFVASLQQQQRVAENRLEMNTLQRQATIKSGEIGQYKAVEVAGRVLVNEKTINVVKDAVQTYGGFADAISAVEAKVGSYGDGIERLSKKAKQLGASTAFTAKQAAESENFLAAAGFKVDDIITALPSVLDLSSAGALDPAIAADIASNVLSGFKLQSKQFAHVADVMAQTSRLRNTNIEQMGKAMEYAATPAKMYGASLEEVAAGIGVMSDAGVQADKAGTAFRGMFIRLASLPPKAKKAADALGLQLTDDSGKMRNYIDVMDDLSHKLDPALLAKAKDVGYNEEELQKIVANSDAMTQSQIKNVADLTGTTAISGVLAMIQDVPKLQATALANIGSSTNEDLLKAILDKSGISTKEMKDTESIYTSLLKQSQGNYSQAKAILEQATAQAMQMNVQQLDSRSGDMLKTFLANQEEKFDFKQGESVFDAILRQSPSTEMAISTVNAAMEQLGLSFKYQGSTVRNMAKIMEHNLPGSIRALGSAFESVKINFFEPIAPAIKLIIDSATKFLLFLSNLPGPVRSAITVVGSLVLSLGAMAIAVGAVGATFTAFKQALLVTKLAEKTMSSGLIPLTGFFATSMQAYEGTDPIVNLNKTLQVGFTNLKQPINDARLAMIGFGRASLAFAASPAGLAIIALTGLYVLLEKATPEFSLLGAAIAALGAPFAFVAGIIKGVFGEAFQFLSEILGSGGGIASAPFVQFAQSVKSALVSLTQFVDKGEVFGKYLTKVILIPFRVAGKIVQKSWEMILSTVTLPMTLIVAAFTGAIGKISTAWQGFVEKFTLNPLVIKALTTAKALIDALNHNPTERIPEAWEAAVEDIRGSLDTLPPVGKTIAMFLINALNHGPTEQIPEAWDGAVTDIKGSLNTLPSAGQTVGEQLNKSMFGSIGEGLKSLVSLITSVGDAIKSAISGAFIEVAYEVIPDLITNIDADINSLIKSIGSIGSTIVQSLTSAFNNFNLSKLIGIGGLSRDSKKIQQESKNAIPFRDSSAGWEVNNQDQLDELLAKRIAYVDFKELSNPDTKDPKAAFAQDFLRKQNLQIVKFLQDGSGTGFDAIELASTVSDVTKLIFRGSKGRKDFADDLTGMPGDMQFQGNKEWIRSVLESEKERGRTVELLGHSLGGALSQITAANFPGLVDSVKTFNTAGVGKDLIEKFTQLGDSIPVIKHFIHRADFVTTSGDGILPGEVHAFANTNWTKDFLSPLGNHLSTLLDSRRTDIREIDLPLSDVNSLGYQAGLFDRKFVSDSTGLVTSQVRKPAESANSSDTKEKNNIVPFFAAVAAPVATVTETLTNALGSLNLSKLVGAGNSSGDDKIQQESNKTDIVDEREKVKYDLIKFFHTSSFPFGIGEHIAEAFANVGVGRSNIDQDSLLDPELLKRFDELRSWYQNTGISMPSFLSDKNLQTANNIVPFVSAVAAPAVGGVEPKVADSSSDGYAKLTSDYNAFLEVLRQPIFEENASNLGKVVAVLKRFGQIVGVTKDLVIDAVIEINKTLIKIFIIDPFTLVASFIKSVAKTLSQLGQYIFELGRDFTKGFLSKDATERAKAWESFETNIAKGVVFLITGAVTAFQAIKRGVDAYFGLVNSMVSRAIDNLDTFGLLVLSLASLPMNLIKNLIPIQGIDRILEIGLTAIKSDSERELVKLMLMLHGKFLSGLALLSPGLIAIAIAKGWNEGVEKWIAQAITNLPGQLNGIREAIYGYLSSIPDELLMPLGSVGISPESFKTTLDQINSSVKEFIDGPLTEFSAYLLTVGDAANQVGKRIINLIRPVLEFKIGFFEPITSLLVIGPAFQGMFRLLTSQVMGALIVFSATILDAIAAVYGSIMVAYLSVSTFIIGIPFTILGYAKEATSQAKIMAEEVGTKVVEVAQESVSFSKKVARGAYGIAKRFKNELVGLVESIPVIGPYLASGIEYFVQFGKKAALHLGNLFTIFYKQFSALASFIGNLFIINAKSAGNIFSLMGRGLIFSIKNIASFAKSIFTVLTNFGELYVKTQGFYQYIKGITPVDLFYAVTIDKKILQNKLATILDIRMDAVNRLAQRIAGSLGKKEVKLPKLPILKQLEKSLLYFSPVIEAVSTLTIGLFVLRAIVEPLSNDFIRASTHVQMFGREVNAAGIVLGSLVAGLVALPLLLSSPLIALGVGALAGAITYFASNANVLIALRFGIILLTDIILRFTEFAIKGFQILTVVFDHAGTILGGFVKIVTKGILGVIYVFKLLMASPLPYFIIGLALGWSSLLAVFIGGSGLVIAGFMGITASAELFLAHINELTKAYRKLVKTIGDYFYVHLGGAYATDGASGVVKQLLLDAFNTIKVIVWDWLLIPVGKFLIRMGAKILGLIGSLAVGAFSLFVAVGKGAIFVGQGILYALVHPLETLQFVFDSISGFINNRLTELQSLFTRVSTFLTQVIPNNVLLYLSLFVTTGATIVSLIIGVGTAASLAFTGIFLVLAGIYEYKNNFKEIDKVITFLTEKVESLNKIVTGLRKLITAPIAPGIADAIGNFVDNFVTYLPYIVLGVGALAIILKTTMGDAFDKLIKGLSTMFGWFGKLIELAKSFATSLSFGAGKLENRVKLMEVAYTFRTRGGESNPFRYESENIKELRKEEIEKAKALVKLRQLGQKEMARELKNREKRLLIEYKLVQLTKKDQYKNLNPETYTRYENAFKEKRNFLGMKGYEITEKGKAIAESELFKAALIDASLYQRSTDYTVRDYSDPTFVSAKQYSRDDKEHPFSNQKVAELLEKSGAGEVFKKFGKELTDNQVRQNLYYDPLASSMLLDPTNKTRFDQAAIDDFGRVLEPFEVKQMYVGSLNLGPNAKSQILPQSTANQVSQIANPGNLQSYVITEEDAEMHEILKPFVNKKISDIAPTNDSGTTVYDDLIGLISKLTSVSFESLKEQTSYDTTWMNSGHKSSIANATREVLSFQLLEGLGKIDRTDSNHRFYLPKSIDSYLDQSIKGIPTNPSSFSSEVYTPRVESGQETALQKLFQSPAFGGDGLLKSFTEEINNIDKSVFQGQTPSDANARIMEETKRIVSKYTNFLAATQASYINEFVNDLNSLGVEDASKPLTESLKKNEKKIRVGFKEVMMGGFAEFFSNIGKTISAIASGVTGASVVSDNIDNKEFTAKKAKIKQRENLIENIRKQSNLNTIDFIRNKPKDYDLLTAIARKVKNTNNSSSKPTKQLQEIEFDYGSISGDLTSLDPTKNPLVKGFKNRPNIGEPNYNNQIKSQIEFLERDRDSLEKLHKYIQSNQELRRAGINNVIEWLGYLNSSVEYPQMMADQLMKSIDSQDVHRDKISAILTDVVFKRRPGTTTSIKINSSNQDQDGLYDEYIGKITNYAQGWQEQNNNIVANKLINNMKQYASDSPEYEHYNKAIKALLKAGGKQESDIDNLDKAIGKVRSEAAGSKSKAERISELFLNAGLGIRKDSRESSKFNELIAKYAPVIADIVSARDAGEKLTLESLKNILLQKEDGAGIINALDSKYKGSPSKVDEFLSQFLSKLNREGTDGDDLFNELFYGQALPEVADFKAIQANFGDAVKATTPKASVLDEAKMNVARGDILSPDSRISQRDIFNIFTEIAKAGNIDVSQVYDPDITSKQVRQAIKKREEFFFSQAKEDKELFNFLNNLKETDQDSFRSLMRGRIDLMRNSSKAKFINVYHGAMLEFEDEYDYMVKMLSPTKMLEEGLIAKLKKLPGKIFEGNIGGLIQIGKYQSDIAKVENDIIRAEIKQKQEQDAKNKEGRRAREKGLLILLGRYSLPKNEVDEALQTNNVKSIWEQFLDTGRFFNKIDDQDKNTMMSFLDLGNEDGLKKFRKELFNKSGGKKGDTKLIDSFINAVKAGSIGNKNSLSPSDAQKIRQVFDDMGVKSDAEINKILQKINNSDKKTGGIRDQFFAFLKSGEFEYDLTANQIEEITSAFGGIELSELAKIDQLQAGFFERIQVGLSDFVQNLFDSFKSLDQNIRAKMLKIKEIPFIGKPLYAAVEVLYNSVSAIIVGVGASIATIIGIPKLIKDQAERLPGIRVFAAAKKDYEKRASQSLPNLIQNAGYSNFGEFKAEFYDRLRDKGIQNEEEQNSILMAILNPKKETDADGKITQKTVYSTIMSDAKLQRKSGDIFDAFGASISMATSEAKKLLQDDKFTRVAVRPLQFFYLQVIPQSLIDLLIGLPPILGKMALSAVSMTAKFANKAIDKIFGINLGDIASIVKKFADDSSISQIIPNIRRKLSISFNTLAGNITGGISYLVNGLRQRGYFPNLLKKVDQYFRIISKKFESKAKKSQAELDKNRVTWTKAFAAVGIAVGLNIPTPLIDTRNPIANIVSLSQGLWSTIITGLQEINSQAENSKRSLLVTIGSLIFGFAKGILGLVMGAARVIRKASDKTTGGRENELYSDMANIMRDRRKQIKTLRDEFGPDAEQKIQELEQQDPIKPQIDRIQKELADLGKTPERQKGFFENLLDEAKTGIRNYGEGLISGADDLKGQSVEVRARRLQKKYQVSDMDKYQGVATPITDQFVQARVDEGNEKTKSLREQIQVRKTALESIPYDDLGRSGREYFISNLEQQLKQEEDKIRASYKGFVFGSDVKNFDQKDVEAKGYSYTSTKIKVTPLESQIQSGLMKWVGSLLAPSGQKQGGLWSSISEGIKTAVSRFQEKIASFNQVDSDIDDTSSKFEKFIKPVKATLKALDQTLYEWGTALREKLEETRQNIIDSASSGITSFGGLLMSGIESLIGGISFIADMISTGVRNGITNAGTAISNSRVGQSFRNQVAKTQKDFIDKQIEDLQQNLKVQRNELRKRNLEKIQAEREKGTESIEYKNADLLIGGKVRQIQETKARLTELGGTQSVDRIQLAFFAATQKINSAWLRATNIFKGNLPSWVYTAIRVGMEIAAALNHGAADVTRNAWERTIGYFSGNVPRMVQVAKNVGRRIVGFLNHSAADTVGEAFERNEQVVSNEMHQMAETANTTGSQIAGSMERSANTSVSAFSRLVGAVKSVSKAGMAIGGAIAATGFAAQTLGTSLATIGILDEDQSQSIYKFTQLFTILGAVTGLASPILGALLSTLGAIGSVAGVVISGIAGIGGAIFTFLISPVGLAVVGITAGIFMLNALIKKVFGVDILQGLISSLMTGIGVVFSFIASNIPKLASGIGNAIAPLGDKIKPVIAFIWKGIQDILLAPFAPVVERLQPVIDSVKASFEGAVEWISEAWDKFADKFGWRLSPIIRPAANTAKYLVNTLNHGASDVTAQAWENASGKITGNIETLPDVARVAGKDIGSTLGSIGDTSVGVNLDIGIKDAVENMKGYLNNLLKFATVAGGMIAAAFASKKILGMMDSRGMTGATQRIRSSSGKAANFALYANMFNDVAELGGIDTPDFVTPLLAATTAIGLFGDISETILPKVSGIFRRMGGIVTRSFFAVASAVGGVVPLIGIVIAVVAALGFAWKNNLFDIQGKARSAANYITEVLVGSVEKITQAWQWFVDNFGSKLITLVQPALDVAQKLINALNHFPTEKIPEAWEGAVEDIKGSLNTLPETGKTVGSQLNDFISASIDKATKKINQFKSFFGIQTPEIGDSKSETKGTQSSAQVESGKADSTPVVTPSNNIVSAEGLRQPTQTEKSASNTKQDIGSNIKNAIGGAVGAVWNTVNPANWVAGSPRDSGGEVTKSSIQIESGKADSTPVVTPSNNIVSAEGLRQPVKDSANNLKDLAAIAADGNLASTYARAATESRKAKDVQQAQALTAATVLSDRINTEKAGFISPVMPEQPKESASSTKQDTGSNVKNAIGGAVGAVWGVLNPGNWGSSSEKSKKESPLLDFTKQLEMAIAIAQSNDDKDSILYLRQLQTLNKQRGGLSSDVYEKSIADGSKSGQYLKQSETLFNSGIQGIQSPKPGDQDFVGLSTPEKKGNWWSGIFGGTSDKPKDKVLPVFLDFARQLDTAIKLATYDKDEDSANILKALRSLTGGKITADQFTQLTQESGSGMGRYLKSGERIINAADNPTKIGDVVGQAGRDLKTFANNLSAQAGSELENLQLEFGDRWNYLQRNGFINYDDVTYGLGEIKDSFSTLASDAWGSITRLDLPGLQRAFSNFGEGVSSGFSKLTMGFALIGEIFEPGAAQIGSGLNQLGDSFVTFGSEAWTSLTKLDFEGFKKAATDFGISAWGAIKQIKEGFGSMSLSAIAFGVFSLLSLSPVVLIMGGIALIAISIATNFLGIRDIIFGVIKVFRGLFTIITAIMGAIRGVYQGIQMIATGIMTLDGNFIKAGIDRIIFSVNQGMQGVVKGIRQAAGGIGQTLQGLLKMFNSILGVMSSMGITMFTPLLGKLKLFITVSKTVYSVSLRVVESVKQLWQRFFTSFQLKLTEVGAKFPLVAQSLANAALIPKQAWNGFLELLTRIKNRAIETMLSIMDAAAAAGNKLMGRGKKNQEPIATETELVLTSSQLPDTQLEQKTAVASTPAGSEAVVTSPQVSSGKKKRFGHRRRGVVESSQISSGRKPSGRNFGASKLKAAGNKAVAGGSKFGSNVSQLGMVAPDAISNISQLGFALSAISPAIAQPLIMTTSLIQSFGILKSTILALFPAFGAFVSSAYTTGGVAKVLSESFKWLSAKVLLASKAIGLKIAALKVFVLDAYKTGGALGVLSAGFGWLSAKVLFAIGVIKSKSLALWKLVVSASAASGATTVFNSAIAWTVGWGSFFIAKIIASTVALWKFVTSTYASGGALGVLSAGFNWLSTKVLIAFKAIGLKTVALQSFILKGYESNGVLGLLSRGFGRLVTSILRTFKAIGLKIAALKVFVLDAYKTGGALGVLSAGFGWLSAKVLLASKAIGLKIAALKVFVLDAYKTGGALGVLSAGFSWLSAKVLFALKMVGAKIIALKVLISKLYEASGAATILGAGFGWLSAKVLFAFGVVTSYTLALWKFIVTTYKASGATTVFNSAIAWTVGWGSFFIGKIIASTVALWKFVTSTYAAGGATGVLNSAIAWTVGWGSFFIAKIIASAVALWGFVTSAFAASGATTALNSAIAWTVGWGSFFIGKIIASTASMWGFVTSAYASGGALGVLSAGFKLVAGAAAFAWTSILAPILPFILGAAAIIAAVVGIYFVFKTVFSGIPAFFKGFFDTLFGGFGEVFSGIVDSVKESFSEIASTMKTIGRLIMKPLQPLIELFGGSSGSESLFSGAGWLLAQTILLPFRILGVLITVVVKGIELFIRAIIVLGGVIAAVVLSPFYIVSGLIKGIQLIISGIGSVFTSVFTAIGNGVTSVADSVRNMPIIGQLIEWIAPKKEDTPKYATGGLITGQGTSTGDKILISASRGEFIVNAAATRQNYGLLEAINSGEPLPSLTALPTPPPRMVQPPQDYRPSSGGGAAAMPPMEFNFTFGDIIVQGGSSAEMMNDFLDNLEPKLEQKIRELMRRMLDFMK